MSLEQTTALVNRYIGPAVLQVAAVVFFWWSNLLGLGRFSYGVVIVVYLLVTFWWFVRSVAPEARLWPDGLIVWAVAVPWVTLTIVTSPGAMKGDYDSLNFGLSLVPTLAYGLACAAVTLRLLVRKRRLRSAGEAHQMGSVAG